MSRSTASRPLLSVVLSSRKHLVSLRFHHAVDLLSRVSTCIKRPYRITVAYPFEEADAASLHATKLLNITLLSLSLSQRATARSIFLRFLKEMVRQYDWATTGEEF
ncbi:uncharacterized protein LOC123988467 [Osmia bicornis bicornis]|uniref:uncharacterized protein LOC123988467 n=1 Tax=Osmia bicornis bicornis TaxID=1437191 RepID=UPI001EAF5C1F|nr:uncharacterized protein LOC123988467 [Osmia bicornis bicornis]